VSERALGHLDAWRGALEERREAARV
jgi:hypothetical protein